jgi:drug/metabolite transporter superfamily protein YnfA
VGIFLVSVPLIVYLLVIDKFQFEFWAILGAADIVIIGTFVMLLSSFT